MLSLPREGDPVLVVQKPWICKLLDGEKTLELRGTVCRKPANTIVYLSESGTGAISGCARFVGCNGPLDRETLVARFGEHRVTPDVLDAINYKRVYGWNFVDAARATVPIPYAVKPGSIVWRKYAPIVNR
jgi:hypothetical protein